jgi:hypothetical protein
VIEAMVISVDVPEALETAASENTTAKFVTIFFQGGATRPRASYFTYWVFIACGLCVGPTPISVKRIWEGKDEIDQSTVTVRVYDGDTDNVYIRSQMCQKQGDACIIVLHITSHAKWLLN